MHTCLPRKRKEWGALSYSALHKVWDFSPRFQPFEPKLFLHHSALHFFILDFSARHVPFLPPTCKDSPHPSNPVCVPMKLSLITPGRGHFSLSIHRGPVAFLDTARAPYVYLPLQLQSSLLEWLNSSLTPSLYKTVSQWKFTEKMSSWDGLLLEGSKLANHVLEVCLWWRPTLP